MCGEKIKDIRAFRFDISGGYTGKKRPNPSLQAYSMCREGLAKRISFRKLFTSIGDKVVKITLPRIANLTQIGVQFIITHINKVFIFAI
jgi:hypothetical protein